MGMLTRITDEIIELHRDEEKIEALRYEEKSKKLKIKEERRLKMKDNPEKQKFLFVPQNPAIIGWIESLGGLAIYNLPCTLMLIAGCLALWYHMWVMAIVCGLIVAGFIIHEERENQRRDIEEREKLQQIEVQRKIGDKL